jgi:phospholipid/cholesterol/gamma-HCH transport system substrate-binding protein
VNEKARATALRVGIFLAAGLLIAALALIAIGEKSGLFEGKTTLHVYFNDINGLVVGAPVRLGGLDVGTVEDIEFPGDLSVSEAHVTLSVKSRYMERVRLDSVAFIDSKGLLGDKLINITLGSADQPELQEGATLKTRKSPSMEDLANQAEKTLAAATDVIRSTDTLIGELATDQAKEDVGRILHSVAAILEQVETGEGLAHDLIADPKLVREVEQLLGETRSTVVRLREAVDRIDRTVAAIQHGDGMAHEVVYGQTGKATIEELHQAASEVASIVREVREGEGLIHDLVFEPEEARMLDELNTAAARINRMTEQIEKGRGTLGGLVVDPSVYEDLKRVLGNVERNVLLKALIRFTIKEGDIERPAYVPPPPEAEAAP